MTRRLICSIIRLSTCSRCSAMVLLPILCRHYPMPRHDRIDTDPLTGL